MRRTLLHAICLLVIAIPVTGNAQTGTFTLEDVMSAPFPTELVASPSGARIAWVFNMRGARNIWIADNPSTKARQLTSYAGDDGQEVAELQFTPDAASIVYVRGGSTNRQGENPNPQSNPAGAEQAIWMISTSGGSPRRIGEGNSIAVSPSENAAAFIRRNEVWSARLDGSSEPQRLLRVRGSARNLRWANKNATAAGHLQRRRWNDNPRTIVSSSQFGRR